MTYDSIFINGEGGARPVPALFVKDAVIFHHLALEITEQGKSHSYVFLEAFVRRVAVNTDSQNLRVALFEFGNIRLIRLEFLRSTAREGEHVEGQHHILLAAKV